MSRRLAPATAALVVLVALAPTAAGEPADRVPSDLPDETRTFRDRLSEVADADTPEEMETAYGDADAVAGGVVPRLRELGGSDGDLVAELWTLLGPQVRAGNTSDARSIAGEAASTVDDLVPRVDAWAVNGTTVTPGAADGPRVPIVLIHPPSSGLGAFDVRVHAEDGLPPEAASVAVGQGRSRIDDANASARLASFDAKALAGLGSTSRTAVVLGQVTYPGDAGDVTVDVDVVELVDPDAEPILAVSPAGVARISADGAALPLGLIGLAAVGVLGVGAVVAVRRFVRI